MLRPIGPQGIRALARCQSKAAVANKRFEIVLEDVFILPRTIERTELLDLSPATYAKNLSQAAIVGLNNYASQVVQLLTDKEFATIGAIIGELLPEVQEDILQGVPGAIPSNCSASTPLRLQSRNQHSP